MSISAMKQAAEALEVFSEHGGNRYTRAADALRQAIAEAEKTVYIDSSRFPKDSTEYKPGMTVTKPKQKEDWYGQHQWQCGYERGWDKGYEAGWDNRGEEEKNNWVGLTDEEITDCWEHMGRGLEKHATFAKGIEAKLKEKNS